MRIEVNNWETLVKDCAVQGTKLDLKTASGVVNAYVVGIFYAGNRRDLSDFHPPQTGHRHIAEIFFDWQHLSVTRWQSKENYWCVFIKNEQVCVMEFEALCYETENDLIDFEDKSEVTT